MKLLGICQSVRLSVPSGHHCCCGEFAAVGLAGRRYRLIIARLACNSSCKQCRIVSWRRLVKLAILFCVCTPMQAPGHNAPLILFLISVLYTLFACLCRMFPHLSFFSSLFITFLLPYLSPPLLIFSFENRSTPLSGRMLLKATKPGFSFFCVYLEQGADLHMAQLMPLPLTLSCFCKILIGFAFLVPAYLGCPGKRVVKHVCVFVFYISFDWWMRAFVVLRLVFSIPSQEIGLGKRLRNTCLGSSGT